MDMDSLMRSLGPVQEALKKADAERNSSVIEGTAGGGAVKVAIRGTLKVERVTIAPAAAASAQGDVGMLEDLVAAALGDALRQYAARFGGSPDEQVQKMLGSTGMGAMLGPLMGMLNRKTP